MSEPSRHTLTAGMRLGPYEVLSPLGAGGMGEVYKGRDTRLDRTVAIKVLPEALAGDPQFRERFDREARAISQLDHPHICALYDVGEHDGAAFLVMPYLEGETLADRLAKGALPLDQALKTAIEIASALDRAHRAGITHRDLKPGNVMLTKAGAKLLDFGLAKTRTPVSVSGTMAPTVAPNLTAQGSILGTFQYMAPEQLEGQEADARTDVFAFGALLYELLTGRRAFEGKSQASLIGAIMHADPPPMSTLQPLTPTALDRLVKVCLAKNADERWQSVGDVRRELQWIADGGSQTPAAMPVVARRHAREYFSWGLTTLATLVAIGFSMRYLRAPRQVDAIVRFTVSPPVGAVRPALDGFAMAPDGQSLAFTAKAADGVSRIFVRRLDAAEARPLAGTDRSTLPFWAPDSRSLGFAKEGGLYRVDLDGSPPHRLCDADTAFRGGTWGSRGVIVFASAGAGLLRVPDSGGISTPVTTLDLKGQEAAHTGPWFLPDGRHLLFLATLTAQAINESPSQKMGAIWATAIDDPARTRIVESDGAATYADGWLLWSTRSVVTVRNLVAQRFDPQRMTLQGTPQPIRDRLTGPTLTGRNPGFSVSSSGVLVVDRPPPILHQLVWLDRTGQTVGTVGPIASITDFTLAPDERRVVAKVTESDSLKRDLWLFDTGREDGTRLTYEGNTMRPLWALDGRHVFFTDTSDRPLRTLAIGATAAEEFESQSPPFHFEDVTKDGRYVVFRTLTPSAEIGLQRVGSPREFRALVKNPFKLSQARVSSDSRWLAYTVELPGGTQIVAQPFDRPGEPIQVSPKGGIGAVWRNDGRELYYEGPEGLMAVQTSVRGDVLEAGPPQKLFSLRTQGFVVNQPHNVEVAAHGQRFLVNTIVGDSDNVPLEVTLNWTTGLKR